MWFVLSLNGTGAERWMDGRTDEGAEGAGRGRPQSKLVAQREGSFVAQVGYYSAFILAWLSFVDGIQWQKHTPWTEHTDEVYACNSTFFFFCKFPTDISAYGCHLILRLGLGLCT